MAELSDKGRKLIDIAMEHDEPPPADASWGTFVSRMTHEAPADALPKDMPSTRTRRPLLVVVALVVAIGLAWWLSRPRTPTSTPPAPMQPIPPGTDVPAKAVAAVLPVQQLLSAAEAALAADDPDRAMALLAEHAERAPTDAAAPHRMALRVLTLCAKGEHERARDEAKAFLAAHADSPWSDAVRRSCTAP